MSAGLASLRKLKKDPSLYTTMEQKATLLVEGLKTAAAANGIVLQIDVRGSMFGFFFNEKEVYNFEDALNSDTELFAKFHQGMLNEGVYFACSQFETGFISAAMTEEMIFSVIDKAQKVFKEIS